MGGRPLNVDVDHKDPQALQKLLILGVCVDSVLCGCELCVWTLDVDWSVELEDPTYTPSHKHDNTPPNNNTHINTQHKHHTPPTTPPPQRKDSLVKPLFPIEAKPPTCQPCSCENRLVVRALVEWMCWMVGEETGLFSPRRLRQPTARCCATTAKV